MNVGQGDAGDEDIESRVRSIIEEVAHLAFTPTSVALEEREPHQERATPQEAERRQARAVALQLVEEEEDQRHHQVKMLDESK